MRRAFAAISFALVVALGVDARSGAASLYVGLDDRSVQAGADPAIVPSPGTSLFYAAPARPPATAFASAIVAPAAAAPRAYAAREAPLRYLEPSASSGSFSPSGALRSATFSTSGALRAGVESYLLIYVYAPPHGAAGGSFDFALTVPEPSSARLALGSFGALTLTQLRESPLPWRPPPAELPAAR